MSLCDRNGNVLRSCVTTEMLAFVEAKRYMTVPEIVLEYAKPYSGANIQESAASDIAMYHVKAGTKFLFFDPGRNTATDSSTYIQISTTRNTLAVGNQTNSGMVNLLGSMIINTWVSRFASNVFPDNIVCVDSTRSTIYVKAVTDLYIYFNCDHGEPTKNRIAIIEEPEDWLIDYFANNANTYATDMGFKGFAKLYDYKPADVLTKKSFVYDTERRTPDNADRLKAIPRTIGKNELLIKWIGDSICLASSNAGLENAYRQIVTVCLDAVQNSTTVAGVCYTDGYGTGWDGVASDSQYTGFAGLTQYLEQEPASVPRLTNLVFVAMGTNDFGNAVPLGTIGTDDADTTTFVGSVNQTFNYIEERYKNAAVIVMLPFKRKDWTIANSAGHYLTDYMQILRQLAMTRRHFYVFDVFDKWYVDFDSTGRKFFIDDVHPNEYAHKPLSSDLIDFVKIVMSIEGIRYGYDE